MDRRNQPVAYWGQSLGFWCRLWQSQIEHSLRFWAAFAAPWPRSDAAGLAAEAEAMKEIVRGAAPSKPAPEAARPKARKAQGAATSKRTESRPGAVRGKAGTKAAPLH
ncbi:MAG: hypothetical protein ACK4LQ_06785 [Pararhodobacter sp.]